jgi:Subtilase family
MGQTVPANAVRSPDRRRGGSHRILSSWTALAVAAVLALSTGPLALGAEPDGFRERDAANVGREKAAAILGRTPDTVSPLAYGDPVTSVGGRRYWTGVFRGKGDAQAFVAVDLASGETLDAAAYQAQVESAIGREPRVTPPARARIDDAKRTGSSPLLAYLLSPVDYGPAVKAVRAAHPEVEWDGDRPVDDDLEVVAAVSQELIRAKAALVARHRGPFLAEARRHGATDVVPLDLAPMVYLRVPATRVDTLAEEPSVRQVRAPAGWSPTMNTAHNAIGANWTDSKGYTGGGVVVGIVEYTRVDYSRPGLAGARRDSYRVSSTGLSCPHSRGQYYNSSAISHVSWAAAIAVGRGTTYKGIANGARLVDVSADFSPTSDRADPRILKAVDCAILQGGAHLITMSLVQNDSSRYSTSNAYFDAVVWDHHRLIVGNGGNNYSESNSHCPGSTERVRSPGSAWNVLTVGGTSNDARRLWYRASGSEPSYCWEDPPGHSGDVNDRVKPELVAPAQNISTYFYNGSGVSASSPMVAGVAAALLDQRPSLLNYPEQMKAILLAGSEAKHALTPGGNQSISAEGLGTVSAKWSSRVAEKDTAIDTGSYGGMMFSGVRHGDCLTAPAAQTIDFEVYPARHVRFVIDWMAHTAAANPRSGSTFTQRFADFNLTIRKGSTVVGSSNRSASNVEWADFYGAVYGAGVYTAVITPVRWGCSVATEPVGWAWVSFGTP